MWRLLLLLPVLAVSVSGGIYRNANGHIRTEIKRVRDNDGVALLLEIRITCTKDPTSGTGVAGEVQIEYTGMFGNREGFTSHPYDHCPTSDDLAKDEREALGFDQPTFPPTSVREAGEKAAKIDRVVGPADDRLYVANLTGPKGRSAVDVFDSQAMQLVTTIDVDDRLFGGVVLSPDGQRAYALLWPSSSLAPPAPAYIAYIDTKTNTIVDRFLLPDLLELQKPALSADGRYLYFAARTQTAPPRIQIADLESKTIAGVLPAAVPATLNPAAVALSPDDALLCAAGQFGVSCYDVRTRTFLGRVALSLPNTALRPLFHSNGSRLYVLGRASLPAGGITIFISVIDTATLTEVTRIPITNPAPNDFRDSLARLSITPDGLLLILDESFKGTLNFVDTRTNKIIKTVEGLTTGSLASTVIVNW